MLKKEKWIILCILVLVVSSIGSLTKEEKIEDFEKLYKTVKEQYPFFERKNIDWNEVYRKYRPIVEKSSDDDEYILILRSMLAELDDGHADIIKPPLSLEGIGALVEEKDNRIIVLYVQRNSPAEASGLKKGAEILEVNGTLVSDYIDSLPNYFKKPRWRLRSLFFHGEKNTSISLTFNDPVEGIKKAEVKRLEKLNSYTETNSYTKTNIISRNLNDEIGYIRIPNFFRKNNIVKDFDRALKDLFRSKGLIIDVRNNPGGSSEISDCIVGRFVEYRVKIGTLTYKKPRYIPGIGFQNVFDHVIKPRGRTYKSPIVVLIDSWCASACELFAISMRDSGRALLVGRKTAGIMGLPGRIKLSGGILAQFSIGDFIRLNGESVEGRGVIPDVQVDNEEEDIEKAIEILKWKISKIK